MADNKKPRVAFILTSHSNLGNTGEKTGFWVEEFAAPYYALADKSVDITIASPLGGQPPIDPKSELPDSQTEATKRYYEDKELQEKLSKTIQLQHINPDEFDAVFYPGGHGPLWDLHSNAASLRTIESFIEKGKPVAAVCHAPAVLLKAKAPNGEPLLKGKKVTGFTNTEEEAVQLTEVVPFLLEDELKKSGAEYSKVEDWQAYAVRDGLVITGQNPASSEKVAEELLKALQE